MAVIEVHAPFSNNGPGGNPPPTEPTPAPIPAPAGNAPAPAPVAPKVDPVPAPITPPPSGPLSQADLTPYVTEFTEKGKLSEDSYKSLEARGFGRDIVDSYVDGQTARAERRNSGIFGAVGGEENFAKVSDWAGKNMEASEVATLNNLLATGDMTVVKSTLQGLQARMGTGGGQRVELNGNGNRTPTGPQPFKNVQAMHEAQRDPRYATSEEYRDSFDERLKASNF